MGFNSRSVWPRSLPHSSSIPNSQEGFHFMLWLLELSTHGASQGSIFQIGNGVWGSRQWVVFLLCVRIKATNIFGTFTLLWEHKSSLSYLINSLWCRYKFFSGTLYSSHLPRQNTPKVTLSFWLPAQCWLLSASTLRVHEPSISKFRSPPQLTASSPLGVSYPPLSSRECEKKYAELGGLSGSVG